MFNNITRIWQAFCNGMQHSRHKQQHQEIQVDTASDDSFPASDPPAWTRTTSQKSTS